MKEGFLANFLTAKENRQKDKEIYPAKDEASDINAAQVGHKPK